MGSLPVGLQQLVELSRVLFSGARIIILDEPTSALSPPEVARLFEALRRLKSAGPHHHLHLAFPRRRARRSPTAITVFRNGRKVITERPTALDQGQRHRRT